MSDISSIITVNLSRETSIPDAEGFGTPMFAVQHSHFADRSREYASTAEMVADGFTTTEPGYRMAAAAFGQNPKLPAVKIGRLANQQTQVVNFTPTNLTEGYVYSLTVTGPGSAVSLAGETITYTVQASDTADEIVDGLVASAAALNAAAGQAGNWTIAGDAGGPPYTYLVITATAAGERFAFSGYGTALDFEDVTPAVSLADDLDAILAEDSDWYALAIESTDKASIVAASNWAETNGKLFVARTADDECHDAAVSDDVISTLSSGTNTRTAIFFHRNNLECIDAAMLGKALPYDAGSINWAWKQLATMTADTLTTAQQSQIDTKGGNVFVTVSGLNVTKFGYTTNGEGIDLVRGSDWTAARCAERLFTLLVQRPKLPYTDAGLQTIRGVVAGVLADGVARDFIAAYPEPVVTVPLASEVSAANKGNRIVDAVEFSAVLAGAINKVIVNGTLSLT